MLSPRCTSCPVEALLSFQTEELLNSPSFSVVERFRLRFFLLLEKLVFLFCVTTQRGLVHTFCFVTTRDVARVLDFRHSLISFFFASRVTLRVILPDHTPVLCSSVTQLRCRHPRKDRFETSFWLTVLHTLVEHLLQLQLLFGSTPLSLFLHCSKLPKKFCNHPLELLLLFRCYVCGRTSSLFSPSVPNSRTALHHPFTVLQSSRQNPNQTKTK